MQNLFQKQFIMPIRQGNERVRMQLQQLTAPFILRRSKKEVAPELPELTEETIYCDMTEEQNTCYEQEKIRTLCPSLCNVSNVSIICAVFPDVPV